MKSRNLIPAFLIGLATGLFPAVTFVTQPTLVKDAGNRLWVEFQVSETTDVAVSIVDLRDSAIIRHLAAGVLGSKVPPPLIPNTLKQRVEWDGKDDLGYSVPNPELLKPRVRAGMGIQFLRYVGSNPYSFTGGLCIYGGGVFGMVQADDGTIFVCGNPGAVHQGHIYTPVKYVRQFDGNGNYLKTVYPFPSTLNVSQVQGWRPVRFPDSTSYTPIHSNNSLPTFSNSLFDVLKQGPTPRLHFYSEGKLLFGGYRSYLTFNTDGGKTDTASSIPLIVTPALPGSISPTLLGWAILTRFPNSNDILISGVFSATASSGHLTAALDTGFYRDGRVFRVNPATRTATVWLDLDTVITNKTIRSTALQGGENYAALHGTSVDGKGRIYVCDRLYRRIGIYDSSATLLGQIPLPAPDHVRISGKTGEIFALTRFYNPTTSKGYMRLFKYAPFESGAALICSLEVSAQGYRDASMLVDDSASPRKIWVGIGQYSGGSGNLKIFQDNGAAFALFKDFDNPALSQTPGFDRLAVDRRNETVYFNDSWWGLYKIEDWNNPVIRPCSTSANKRMQGLDCAISPHNELYVRYTPKYGNVNSQDNYPSISRFTLDRLHAPLNWANTDSNIMAPSDLQFSVKSGVSVAERGLAVNTGGVVACLHMPTRMAHQVSFYSDSGSSTLNFGDVKISPIMDQCGGVKFDLKGNLYVGAKIRAPEHQIPAVYNGNYGYSSAVGAVIRFPAGFDTASITAAGITGGTGHKIYTQGLAPYSKEPSGGNCICRSPRFDVDPYGRLFMPNAITNQVTVADNEGNEILRFGRYGNIDGPAGGALVSLNWPTSVAASEDFIYVADYANTRIARLAMNYQLDNHPEISSTVQTPVREPMETAEMAAAPNPFNPAGMVTVTLSGISRVRLDVFGPAGRFITTLASDVLPAGRHRFVWNGTGMTGEKVAAGVYYLRLAVGTRELFSKVVLVK